MSVNVRNRSSIRRFDEVMVVFRLDAAPADACPGIVIDGFVLVRFVNALTVPRLNFLDALRVYSAIQRGQQRLLLQNRAIPICNQPRPHRLRILNVDERPNLHMKQLICRDRRRYKSRIVFFLERIY